MSVALRDVTVRQGAFTLDRATLEVPDGAYGVVLGAAGSGKTTLLETIAGIRAPSSGMVSLRGADVTGVAIEVRGVALVYQQSLLFPHLDVRQNIAYGAANRAAIDDAVQHTGVEPLLARSIMTLSGGEQQLVALARAIASQPTVLLLDEPFAALDPPRRAAMRRMTRALQRDRGITVVHVTHDVGEAALLADTLAVLDAGRILQHGVATDVFAHPASGRVAELLGAENVLAGVATMATDGMVELRAGAITIHALPPNGCAVTGPAHGVIGADEITLSREAKESSARNAFTGRVVAVSGAGALVRVEIDVAGTTLVAVVTAAAARELRLASGEQVHLAFKATAVRIC
ncbi:MAG: ABC transporter ATP-binding protein [Gemmatimonadaceae bacterium]